MVKNHKTNSNKLSNTIVKKKPSPNKSNKKITNIKKLKTGSLKLVRNATKKRYNKSNHVILNNNNVIYSIDLMLKYVSTKNNMKFNDLGLAKNVKKMDMLSITNELNINNASNLDYSKVGKLNIPKPVISNIYNTAKSYLFGVIKRLSLLNTFLDYKFVSKDKLKSINTDYKIYNYECINENIKLMDIAYNLLSKNENKITDMKRVDIVFIIDGFARSVSRYINRFHPQKHKLSNAYVKLWEIYSTFDWLINKKDMNFFHMAEAPGQWINTTNTFMEANYKDINYNWLANSLNPDHPRMKGIVNALSDDYGFIKKYKEKWLYGADNSGDITMSENIKWFDEYVHKQMPVVDIVTGDAGITTEVPIFSLLQKLEIAQAILVAHTATKESSCVIKHFLPFLPSRNESYDASGFHMSLMYLYYCMFEEFHMFKPLSSSPGSGEYYVVCRKFKGLTKKVKKELLTYLDNFDTNLPLFPESAIPKSFVDKVCDFVNRLMKINIDNKLFHNELNKCLLKRNSILNCNYYFGKGFRDEKYKVVREYIKKFNLLKL